MPRSGSRDTSRIIEIRLFFDEGHTDGYLSLANCLSTSLQLINGFPLLRLEQNDQLIKINDIDVRQSKPEQILAILESLTINGEASEPLTKDNLLPPKKDQILYLTYIKGTDLQPEKHLAKDQVNYYSIKQLKEFSPKINHPNENLFPFQPLPCAIEHWAFCTRCDERYQWIPLPEPRRFPTKHDHKKERSTKDVS